MLVNKEEKEPFLGRFDEQDRFRETLRNVLSNRKILGKVKDWLAEKEPTALPYLFLIYGEGGMGKTRLSQRLAEITQNDAEFKSKFHVIQLDWQRRKELDYRLRVRDEVSPELVFEHIYAVFRDEGFGRQFDDYEKAVKERAESEAKVAQALERTIENRDDRYAPLREGGAKMLSWLLRTATPGGAAIPEEPTAKLFEAIIGGGAAGLARAREAATTLVRAALTDPKAFDLFMLPNETLAYRLADGIRVSALKKPILLNFDTYEIIDRSDTWLRVVIKRVGPGVTWIVAGRDNLADTRKYGQHSFTGYRADFPSDRLRVFPLGEFSVPDVKEYFEYHVPSRPLDSISAEAIHRATLGVPLAVQEAAAIWANSSSALNDITGDEAPSRNRDKIVQKMTERFLLHCFDDPNHVEDKMHLYALALVRTPDPELLAAICQTDDLEQDLNDLERRHSFVFVDEMRLHDKVSSFLREYLMQDIRRKSSEVRGIHERAIEHLETQKKTREENLRSLEARIDDDRWASALLNLSYHSFWLEEELGWKTLISAYVGGLTYNVDFARALIETAEGLLPTFSQASKRKLKNLKRDFVSASIDESSSLLNEIESSASTWPEDDCNIERQAIIELCRGIILYRQKQFPNALDMYERVERRLLDQNKKLREQLGTALDDLSAEFIWPDNRIDAIYSPYAEKILEKVSSLLPDKAGAWYRLGVTYSEARKLGNAINAYKKAIELDPKFAYPWNGLGYVYSNLKQSQDAINAYKKAIELDPKFAYPWNGLGYVYSNLKQSQDAINAYKKAIEIDPNFASPWNGLGTVYSNLKQSQDAINAFNKAIELNANDAYPWNNLGSIYRDLKQIDDAIKAYSRAIDLPDSFGDPTSAHSLAWNGLGSIYRDLKQSQDAINAYKKAIEIDPNFAPHWNQLGLIYSRAGDIQNSLKSFEKAVKIEGNNGSYRASYARVLKLIGNVEEAEKQIEVARALMEDESTYNRACFEAICGNIEEALKLLQKAIEEGQDIEWVRNDLDWESLRDDERFKKLIGEDNKKETTS